MDITQAAFGLDMQSASRIYFLSPVLNPQVEAQAVGRARRVSQRKPVSVETLVLRGSVEEVVVRRRGEMSAAEQWRCRSILDDGAIYRWILGVGILPLEGDMDGMEGMARLERPLGLFGRGFGRATGDPDQDLVGLGVGEHKIGVVERGGKRSELGGDVAVDDGAPPPKKRVRVRFAGDGEE